MNQIHISNFVWSVAAAIVLMLCLGLALVAMMLVGQGEDAIENEDNTGQSVEAGEPTDCFFTANTERLTIYLAPIAAPSQQKTTVLGSEQYAVIRENGDFYEVQVAEDTGWVIKDAGVDDGDCDDVPNDDTPITEFSTVCIFSNEADVTLFTEADLINAVGTAPSGNHLVEAVNTDLNRYYVVMNDGFSGWVAPEGGTIAGAGCEALTGTPQ
jgi:hypothetical protein